MSIYGELNGEENQTRIRKVGLYEGRDTGTTKKYPQSEYYRSHSIRYLGLCRMFTANPCGLLAMHTDSNRTSKLPVSFMVTNIGWGRESLLLGLLRMP